MNLLNDRMCEIAAAIDDLEPEIRDEVYCEGMIYLSIPVGYLEAIDISWSDEPDQELLINWLQWDRSHGLNDEKELAVLPHSTDTQTIVTLIRKFYQITTTE